MYFVLLHGPNLAELPALIIALRQVCQIPDPQTYCTAPQHPYSFPASLCSGNICSFTVIQCVTGHLYSLFALYLPLSLEYFYTDKEAIVSQVVSKAALK